MGLTGKQRVFVEEYLTCWNASEAARRAGYSETGAAVAGTRLLTNDKVSAEIARRVADKTMTANEVLTRLAEQARASVEDFLEIREGIRDPYISLHKAAALGKLHLVKKFKYDRDGRPEFELHDAQAALVQLGKALGIFDRAGLGDNNGEVVPVAIVKMPVDEL